MYWDYILAGLKYLKTPKHFALGFFYNYLLGNYF